ncbi:MAG: heme ABC exporter ATP-binding protein CcmA [Rhodospirillales bacterium]|nr:heme ABC exporter ATP-binding protein CcmA [Rhodospirillales bacterium]
MAEFSGSGLDCVRSERLVFAALSFCLDSGGAMVLVGRNGAGKSSLLRMMAGFLAPVAGTLMWDGELLVRDLEAHRRRVRYVGHADAIKPPLTVIENVRTWAVLWGGRAAAEERCFDALSAFAIDHLADVPGRYLSAGQRRRLALARLLVAPAALWLLDEPRTALDAEAIGLLDEAIAGQRRRGGMVAMALHGGAHPPGASTLDLGGLGAFAGSTTELPAC